MSVVIRGARKYNERYTDARDGKAGEFASGLARTPARHAAERFCFFVRLRQACACLRRAQRAALVSRLSHIFMDILFVIYENSKTPII